MFLFRGSKIFATPVLARCFQGIFNGNIGVVRMVMGEITNTTNRADVIAYIPVVWSIDDRPHETYGAIPPGAGEEEEDFKPPTFISWMTKPIVMVLLAYMAFAFVDMCTYALLPLAWSTSIENGGLGFTARRIGTINAIFGIPNALFQILLLGRTLRYLGAKKLSIIAFTGTLFCLLMSPITNALAREAGGTDWKVWTAIVIQLLFLSTLYAGYTSLSMYLLEISPSPAALGTIQGLGQTMSVVSRYFAPTIATSLFAFSTEGGYLGGNLVFVILGLVDIGAIIFVCFLPNI
ncbi:major facilitator superfamily domain-containing protein [Flagelloscypha sp. PMI_526]|nr:major facilitator superfamily domain-containing protein [Flagelloscypha sp. PMI_526]